MAKGIEMRKVIVFWLILTVLLVLCFLFGCQEEQITNKSNLQEQLIKSPVDWIEKYGNSMESQQTANIVLAIQVINRQGEALNQLNERLAVLEKVTDPNGAKGQ